MTAAPRPLDLEGARAGAAVYLESTRERVAVTGEDRFKWLQGIVTNEVLALEKGHGVRATYACALSEKGKILGDVVVLTDGKALGAWVPREVAPSLLAHWERFVIMDDVELALDDERRLIMLQGGRASDVAHATGIAARGAAFDDLGAGGGLVFDVHRDEAQEIVKRLVREGAVSLEPGDVHTIRVAAGRPTFGFDFDDKTYVQEAGLEKRAVSFNKGCYHGQEVVVMLEMRGKASRRLAQLAIPGGAEVQPGAEVRAGDTPVGKVTSAISAEGSAVALAMIKAAHAKPGEKLTVATHEAEVRALVG